MKILTVLALLASCTAFADRTLPAGSFEGGTNSVPVCNMRFTTVKQATGVCASYGRKVISDLYGINCDCSDLNFGNAGRYPGFPISR